jgi:hypothetical protein
MNGMRGHSMCRINKGFRRMNGELRNARGE